MKYLASFIFIIALISCDLSELRNWDPKPRRINFGVYTIENNTYREIRIYGKEFIDGDTVAFDSTKFNARNWDGTDETFRIDRPFGQAFFADSVINIHSGWFEAVAVKKDFSLIKKSFGKITDGQTHENYKIMLGPSGIIVEWLY